MSTDMLQNALHDAGIRARVEAHGRLAVVVADEAHRWTAVERSLADSAARAAGFTHVALEIPADATSD